MTTFGDFEQVPSGRERKAAGNGSDLHFIFFGPGGELRLFLFGGLLVVAAHILFGASIDQAMWRIASYTFAFGGAYAVYRRMDSRTERAFWLSTVAGILVSCGGGVVRTWLLLDQVTATPGSFGDVGDLMAVILGIAIAHLIAFYGAGSDPGGRGGGGKPPPLPQTVRVLDVASGISFSALGVLVAYFHLLPQHALSVETMCIWSAGWATACGGGLLMSLVNAWLGIADGVPNLRTYGLAMALFAALFTVVSLLAGGIHSLLHLAVTIGGTGVYLKVTKTSKG